jgi:hypothetical protein
MTPRLDNYNPRSSTETAGTQSFAIPPAPSLAQCFHHCMCDCRGSCDTEEKDDETLPSDFRGTGDAGVVMVPKATLLYQINNQPPLFTATHEFWTPYVVLRSVNCAFM